jgi:hypothetical protein
MIDVSNIQKRLAELGIYTGAIDGKAGKLTITAIKSFQRTHGLKVDGIAGPMTIAEMFPAAIPGRDDDGPEVPGIKPVWPRQKDVERFFGTPGTNQTMLELPFPMRLAWDKRKIVNRFSIHEKVHDSAARCFDRIADQYDAKARELIGIDLFGGCLNVRKMRGGSAWSMHAWGIAIDLNPAQNQLKWDHTRARFALPDCRKLHEIFESEGWVSLGRAVDRDWMHWQAARL